MDNDLLNLRANDVTYDSLLGGPFLLLSFKNKCFSGTKITLK